jgi:hypothetical protein
MSEGLPARAQAQDGAEILYDWFKHVTSLALFTIGGVLTLHQLGEQEFKKPLLVGVLVVIAMSGLAGFVGAEMIVRARITQTPLPPLVFKLLTAASFILAMGVGSFVTLFLLVVK